MEIQHIKSQDATSDLSIQCSASDKQLTAKKKTVDSTGRFEESRGVKPTCACVSIH